MWRKVPVATEGEPDRSEPKNNLPPTLMSLPTRNDLPMAAPPEHSKDPVDGETESAVLERLTIPVKVAVPAEFKPLTNVLPVTVSTLPMETLFCMAAPPDTTNAPVDVLVLSVALLMETCDNMLV